MHEQLSLQLFCDTISKQHSVRMKFQWRYLHISCNHWAVFL